jgi:DNA-binding NtrC family response regulator
MTAALVGWYVELARLQPAFAEPGEQPVDALSRVKPLLVVLVDALSEEAISDLFIARASKREIGVAIFSGSSDDHEAREWARRNDVPFFKLPVDLEAFGRVLDQAARAAGEDSRRGDRRRPAVERAVDGTLLLVDEAGKAWYVYDRRTADRRAYRAFVSGDGTEVRAPLSEEEFAAREANALIQQLARAELEGR